MSRTWLGDFPMGVRVGCSLRIITDPFVCPKKVISPINFYSRDGMFRPSILLDQEGSGFLGVVN